MFSFFVSRAKFGIREETLLHGSYSDYVREFQRQKEMETRVSSPSHGSHILFVCGFYVDFMCYDFQLTVLYLWVKRTTISTLKHEQIFQQFLLIKIKSA